MILVLSNIHLYNDNIKTKITKKKKKKKKKIKKKKKKIFKMIN